MPFDPDNPDFTDYLIGPEYCDGGWRYVPDDYYGEGDDDFIEFELNMEDED
jgi:hypothetical protein